MFVLGASVGHYRWVYRPTDAKHFPGTEAANRANRLPPQLQRASPQQRQRVNCFTYLLTEIVTRCTRWILICFHRLFTFNIAQIRIDHIPVFKCRHTFVLPSVARCQEELQVVAFANFNTATKPLV